MTDAKTEHEPERRGQRLIAFYDQKPLKVGDSGGVEQLPVSKSSIFHLDGPAATRVVYVAHPKAENRLIPFAEYDELLARDRLNEALRVFTTLGASRIVATSDRSDRKRRDGRVGVGVAKVRIETKKDSTWTVEIDQVGHGGAPRDPRPLRYPDEPGLDSACDFVLYLGGRRCAINIERTTQYGVDGELAIRLKRAGFRLGVGSTRRQTSVFRIEAAFGADAVGALDVAAGMAPEGGDHGGRIRRRWRQKPTTEQQAD